MTLRELLEAWGQANQSGFLTAKVAYADQYPALATIQFGDVVKLLLGDEDADDVEMRIQKAIGYDALKAKMRDKTEGSQVQ